MQRLLIPVLIGALVTGATLSVAMAQSTADAPISAVPPAGRHDSAGTTHQSSQPGSSGQATGTVRPGPASGHGDTNVGNSSESKGMIGSNGAGASATMQSGRTSNR